MRRIFYVDLAMCGGESLPDDFDLEDFCEVLQGKVEGDIEVVPVSGAAVNRAPSLVNAHLLQEALGEYCRR